MFKLGSNKKYITLTTSTNWRCSVFVYKGNILVLKETSAYTHINYEINYILRGVQVSCVTTGDVGWYLHRETI